MLLVKETVKSFLGGYVCERKTPHTELTPAGPQSRGFLRWSKVINLRRHFPVSYGERNYRNVSHEFFRQRNGGGSSVPGSRRRDLVPELSGRIDPPAAFP
jgi:hypothetical protein